MESRKTSKRVRPYFRRVGLFGHGENAVDALWLSPMRRAISVVQATSGEGCPCWWTVAWQVDEKAGMPDQTPGQARRTFVEAFGGDPVPSRSKGRPAGEATGAGTDVGRRNPRTSASDRVHGRPPRPPEKARRSHRHSGRRSDACGPGGTCEKKIGDPWRTSAERHTRMKAPSDRHPVAELSAASGVVRSGGHAG